MKSVRLHRPSGGVNVEPIRRFAISNGTDIKGAERILQIWAERGYLMPRKDGGFDVIRDLPRRHPETLAQLLREGHTVIELRVKK